MGYLELWGTMEEPKVGDPEGAPEVGTGGEGTSRGEEA